MIYTYDYKVFKSLKGFANIQNIIFLVKLIVVLPGLSWTLFLRELRLCSDWKAKLWLKASESRYQQLGIKVPRGKARFPEGGYPPSGGVLRMDFP